MTAKDSRPLLTFATVADCEFFKYAEIERLAVAGKFEMPNEQRAETAALIERFFNRMLNQAFIQDSIVTLNEVSIALKHLKKLKLAVETLEPKILVKSPASSFPPIERFLTNAEALFKENERPLKREAHGTNVEIAGGKPPEVTTGKNTIKKRGRKPLPKSKTYNLVQACALYQLLSRKTPGKTRKKSSEGPTIRFVKEFFRLARERLFLYQFDSKAIEHYVIKSVFWVPSEDSIVDAIDTYLERGQLDQERSRLFGTALFNPHNE